MASLALALVLALVYSHRLEDFQMEVPFSKWKWPCPLKDEIPGLCPLNFTMHVQSSSELLFRRCIVRTCNVGIAIKLIKYSFIIYMFIYKFSTHNKNITYMLGAIGQSARSTDCAALLKDQLAAQQSVDCPTIGRSRDNWPIKQTSIFSPDQQIAQERLYAIYRSYRNGFERSTDS